MRREDKAIRLCGNEGCGRPAPAGEAFCETCALEWNLYRRDSGAVVAERAAGPPASRPAPRPPLE
jgi:hypothetical protein